MTDECYNVCFVLGKVRVLKCLLSMHSMFAECESYHVHSQLYLEPYIIWIQSVPVENLNNLAVALEKVMNLL